MKGHVFFGHVWRLKDIFMESVLSFHLYLDSKNWTEVASLAQQMPLLIELSCLQEPF